MKGTAVTNGPSTQSERTGAEAAGLTRDDFLAAYRTMVLSRRIDDKEIQLKNQSLIYFQISGAGHEAILVAAGMTLKAGHDWFYPYYRDRALCLTIGVTPYEMFLAGVGAKDDPSSGGRQMPSHWGHKRLNIVSQSSPTGTQALQAIGCAEASQLFNKITTIERRSELFQPDEVVYLSVGEGATSEGEFWESLNTACLERLPLVCVVEDNGYAISVPVEVQTAGGDISKLVSSFPGLFVQSIDGTDFLASYRAMVDAVAYARARKGPSLVHAKVIRPYSHSLSDDEKLYKTPDERTAEAKRDPIVRLAAFLKAEGFATQAELETLAREVDAEVNTAAEQAKKSREAVAGQRDALCLLPGRRPILGRVRYTGGGHRQAGHDGRRDQSHTERRDGAQLSDRGVRGRRCGLQSRIVARAGARQGRCVQGHARASADVWRRPRLQLTARRSKHRRTRNRNGDPRIEAGRRDPVLRLYLAGDDADARRDVDAAVSIQQRVFVSDGNQDRDRRVSSRRRTLSQPVG